MAVSPANVASSLTPKQARKAEKSPKETAAGTPGSAPLPASPPPGDAARGATEVAGKAPSVGVVELGGAARRRGVERLVDQARDALASGDLDAMRRAASQAGTRARSLENWVGAQRRALLDAGVDQQSVDAAVQPLLDAANRLRHESTLLLQVANGDRPERDV